MGEVKQAGTYKHELESSADRLKSTSAADASDHDDMGVQQKPGQLVVELNTHIWPRKQKN